METKKARKRGQDAAELAKDPGKRNRCYDCDLTSRYSERQSSDRETSAPDAELFVSPLRPAMIARANFDAAQAIDRVLLVMELLQASSRPLTTGTLVHALAGRTGREWSRDTVTRDLRVMLSRGLVAQSGGGRGATVTWRWVGALTLRPTA